MTASKKIIQAAAGNAGGDFYPYTIDNSVRLDGSSCVQRTPSSTSSTTTWTFSAWVKPIYFTGYQFIFSAGDAGSNVTNFFYYDGTLRLQDYSPSYRIYSNAVFRDPSAWYHVVAVFDTTNATSSERYRMYVNGERITSFSIATYPSQNYAGGRVNSSSYQHRVGGYANFASYWLKGYMAEVHFVDGTALDASSFGQNKNGVWIPKSPSVTYGTNGFYLAFQDSSSLGDDTSGNTNDFTSSGLTSSDQMIDTPTNNFATLNPLVAASNTTYSEGNLKLYSSANSHKNNKGTIQIPNSGKWYYEFAHYGSTVEQYGIVASDSPTGTTWAGTSNSVFFHASGQLYVNGSSSSYGSSLSSGDIVQVAIDFDNGKFWAGKNGTWFNSGNPATGTNAGTSSITDDVYVPHTRAYYSGSYLVANFGQDSSFAGNKTRQGNTDENGIGDFYYAPPSGYLALCTANLPEPTIGPNSDTLSDENFNTVLYTGNGTTNAISGVGFQPDLVWLKNRNYGAGTNHVLIDAIRGASNGLASNLTNGVFPTTGNFSSINSDGFTVDGTTHDYNYTTDSFVAWNWKANGSGVSNTDGSITSTVSANQDAGFSIVSYTGNGTSGATVGHGLTSSPDLIILKNRDDGLYNWRVFHSSLSAGYNMSINTTSAAYASGNGGYISSVSSSVFTLTNAGSGGSAAVNDNGDNIIAYCFTEVEGFSKFGGYTGNGSSDGPFIWTGMRPAWVMVKRTDSTSNWFIYDSIRNTYNVANLKLYADQSLAENGVTGETTSTNNIDILSNGFKMRSANGSNASGGSYIFVAFAEMPFRYSNAR